MNLRHPRLKVLQVRKRYGRHHHPGMQLVAKDIFELMSGEYSCGIDGTRRTRTGNIMCQARLAKAADENILDKWQSIQ